MMTTWGASSLTSLTASSPSPASPIDLDAPPLEKRPQPFADDRMIFHENRS